MGASMGAPAVGVLLLGEQWHQVPKRSPCQSCGEANVSHAETNFPTSEVRGTSTDCMEQDADESKFKTFLMNNSLNVCE